MLYDIYKGCSSLTSGGANRTKTAYDFCTPYAGITLIFFYKSEKSVIDDTDF